MSRKYAALFKPLKIRGVILKNRMLSTASTPHFLQGKEPYPTEKVISHFANRAKNGAAAVYINHFHKDDFPFPGRAIDNPPGHFNLFDINDYTAQNYFCQLIDSIHFYGGKATGYIMSSPDWFYKDGQVPPPPGDMPPMPGMGEMEPQCTENDRDRSAADDNMPGMLDVKDITKEMMQNYYENVAREASDLKRLGFDIISMHCCYRHSPQAQLASPITNHRTDEYGGSVENRNRFILEMYQAMRKAVGNDTPLEIVYSVCEDGGYTVEDTIEFAKMANGLIDVLHLRSGDMDPQHPLGYTSTEECPAPYLEDMGKVCKAVHELGLDMVVAASAGFQDPDIANGAIEDGKADLIGMARAWINNPDYVTKVSEGRKDDITPCIRCNKCHVPCGKDMWRSFCSVNPKLGLEDKLERMIDPPSKSLKVAVIGGGPAGMEYAMTAAQRGHKVTLYEAADELGGALKHTDYASFKWPLKQFKNYLIHQMDKNGVELKLGTKATGEMIKAGGYDAVAVAIGAEPTCPPIPGSDGDNVRFAANCYGDVANELSDEIVMIGGGDIGVETALYLAELGKKVKVLEMLPELIADAPHAHYKNMVHNYWRREPNFSFKCGVRVTSIDKDGVNYIDHKGNEGKAPCKDVLLAIGMKAKTDGVMEFADCADIFHVLGDCESASSVAHAVRTGFALASTL